MPGRIHPTQDQSAPPVTPLFSLLRTNPVQEFKPQAQQTPALLPGTHERRKRHTQRLEGAEQGPLFPPPARSQAESWLTFEPRQVSVS